MNLKRFLRKRLRTFLGLRNPGRPPKVILPIDDERAEAMLKMAQGGTTLEAIGKAYGVSRQRVQQIVGVGVPRERLARIRLELEPQIKRLWEQGKSQIVIARELGISIARVQEVGLGPAPRKIAHGTLKGYRNGCRCDQCRRENAAHTRDVLHNLRQKGLCIMCHKPSPKFWRCDECAGRIPGSPGKGPRCPGVSGIFGIGWVKRENRWRVQKKGIYYGEYKTLEEAKARLDEINGIHKVEAEGA